jgi:DSF synthase
MCQLIHNFLRPTSGTLLGAINMSFIQKHSAESEEMLADLKNPTAQDSSLASRRDAHSRTSRRATSEVSSLSEQIRFLNRTYQELEVTLDPNTKSIWCYMRPKGPPSFTATMVRELIVLHCSIQSLAASQGSDEEPLVRYYVQASQIPGIYNMGGDLSFLADRVRHHDREAIRRYAYSCVDAVYNIAVGFDSGIVSVGLLQGDALGGGLEGALCCNFIVAERGVKMGLPEILFNSFPGMGAYSMLRRRLDSVRAERMIFSGRIYSAEEMYDLGVIDLVVDSGGGEQAVREYIGDVRKFEPRRAIYHARQRANPLTTSELKDITDMWVETTMKLPDADLRRMGHLQAAQVRRLRRGIPLASNA